MTHATASRHVLPILLSCLVLSACAGTPTPEQIEARRICANLRADTDACRQAFLSGYRDQAAALRDGQPFTMSQLVSHVPPGAVDGVMAGYMAGANYAAS